ncbi:MAG: RNA pyrophosphohydrolase [Rickettsiales bacterium]|nr:RNA pyrophosphohydrolase [Rickettsiales bacterium]
MKETIEPLNSKTPDATDPSTLPYRRGVGIMVINNEKKIFVGQRIDIKNNTWQMPQGGIKEDETVSEAGIRELKEETNIVDVQIIAETKNWLYYDVPEFLIEKLWKSRYRGQKQKWLLMYFFGKDSTINIETSSPEFGKWQWLDLKKIPKIVIPFKRHIYLSVVKEFKTIIENF